MGWDKLSGTGVATAQKFVQRPTPFLTRHSASRLGVGNPNEQTPPQSRANRRIHTDRSDPITKTKSLKCRGSRVMSSQAQDLVLRENKWNPSLQDLIHSDSLQREDSHSNGRITQQILVDQNRETSQQILVFIFSPSVQPHVREPR